MAKRTLAQPFGKALRKHREAKGLSQEALAEKAQIHPMHIGTTGSPPILRLRPEIRAKVLIKAKGRCAICLRTIDRHGIDLIVDKIPNRFRSSGDIEIFWTLCEKCSKSALPFEEAFLPRSAIGRIAFLLSLKPRRKVPSNWIKAVAGVENWARCVRRLRSYGWIIIVSRKRFYRKQTLTYYRTIKTGMNCWSMHD